MPVARRVPPGPILLAVLLLAGVIVAWSGLVDWREMVAWGETHAGQWWLPVLLVAGMVVLFTFALPGSALFWVAGILYEPPAATGIVVAGGIGGGLGAYRLAATAGQSWVRARPPGRVRRFLEARSDVLTLVAMRALPTFPHSAINYSAGVLGIPLGRFIAASAVGLACKGWLYVTAIHHAARVGAVEEALGLRVVAPLLGLAVLFMVASLLKARWLSKDPPTR